MGGDSGVHDDIQDESCADLQWWPRRGYVYFYKERLPRWYNWNRSWGREPCYAYIVYGIVAAKWRSDVEYIGVPPDNYEEFDWLDTEDDVLDIITYDFIRSFVEPNDI